MGMNILPPAALVFLVMTTLSSYGDDVDLPLFAKEILKAPDWDQPEVDELIKKRIGKERGEKILNVLGKYTSLSTDQARALLILLSDSGKKTDLRIGGKIYIFNRLYCDVPETVEREGWEFFGGWGGVPSSDKTINALYPLKKNEEGKLELHYLSGSYTGPNYRGVAEFDFLIERFGRREAAK